MSSHDNKGLTIYPQWCKGCGICVGFCPKDALALEEGRITVARPESCIGCRLCEKLCPDYAIYFVAEEVGQNG